MLMEAEPIASLDALAAGILRDDHNHRWRDARAPADNIADRLRAARPEDTDLCSDKLGKHICRVWGKPKGRQ
jgi:hypothetical protein